MALQRDRSTGLVDDPVHPGRVFERGVDALRAVLEKPLPRGVALVIAADERAYGRVVHAFALDAPLAATIEG
jgi:hypothetical protein